MNTSIAEELRAFLARRRISGRQLAAMLGWAPQYLSRRMTGQIPFTMGELYLISQVLDIPLQSLLPAEMSDARSLLFVA